MIVYLDSSAATKLVMEEPESAALLSYLSSTPSEHDMMTSSILLETELRRAAARNRVDQKRVTAMLDRLDLTGLERDMFTAAGLLPGEHLRSLDALHIVAALRTPADVFVSYDARQSDAARACGLAVVTPA